MPWNKYIICALLPSVVFSAAAAGEENKPLSTAECIIAGAASGAIAGAGLGVLGSGLFGAGAALIVAASHQCQDEDQLTTGPTDSDQDGVLDYLDRCPSTPVGAVVDSKGCLPDSDGDGVLDYLDRCHDTPYPAAVDSKGCLLDSDGDGVADYYDRCPDTPYGVAVDRAGCPLDSDGDGVPDYLDACPNTPQGTLVRNNGCPYDSDNDGVYDGIDRCPDTPQGAQVDTVGCELDQQPVIPAPLISYNINFEFDSTELSASSKAILDQAVNALSQDAELVMVITGHADAIGSEKYNLNLSLRRARAAGEYLRSRGINGDRITEEGRGESEPLASNDTKEGRAVNRRVVLLMQ